MSQKLAARGASASYLQTGLHLTQDHGAPIVAIVKKLRAVQTDQERRRILTQAYPAWTERRDSSPHPMRALRAMHAAGYNAHIISDLFAASWISPIFITNWLTDLGLSPHDLPEATSISVPNELKAALAQATRVEDCKDALSRYFPESLRRYHGVLNPYRVAAIQILMEQGCPRKYIRRIFNFNYGLSCEFSAATIKLKTGPSYEPREWPPADLKADLCALYKRKDLDEMRRVLSKACPGWNENKGPILSAVSKKALWALYSAGLVVSDIRVVYGRDAGNLLAQMKTWGVTFNSTKPRLA